MSNPPGCACFVNRGVAGVVNFVLPGVRKLMPAPAPGLAQSIPAPISRGYYCDPSSRVLFAPLCVAHVALVQRY